MRGSSCAEDTGVPGFSLGGAGALGGSGGAGALDGSCGAGALGGSGESLRRRIGGLSSSRGGSGGAGGAGGRRRVPEPRRRSTGGPGSSSSASGGGSGCGDRDASAELRRRNVGGPASSSSRALGEGPDGTALPRGLAGAADGVSSTITDSESRTPSSVRRARTVMLSPIFSEAAVTGRSSSKNFVLRR